VQASSTKRKADGDLEENKDEEGASKSQKKQKIMSEGVEQVF
jgi:hypothetical protein